MQKFPFNPSKYFSPKWWNRKFQSIRDESYKSATAGYFDKAHPEYGKVYITTIHQLEFTVAKLSLNSKQSRVSIFVQFVNAYTSRPIEAGLNLAYLRLSKIQNDSYAAATAIHFDPNHPRLGRLWIGMLDDPSIKNTETRCETNWLFKLISSILSDVSFSDFQMAVNDCKRDAAKKRLLGQRRNQVRLETGFAILRNLLIVFINDFWIRLKRLFVSLRIP